MKVKHLLLFLLLLTACHRKSIPLESISSRTIQTDTLIHFKDIDFTFTPKPDSLFVVKQDGVTIQIRTRKKGNELKQEVQIQQEPLVVKNIHTITERTITHKIVEKRTPAFVKFLAWAGALFLLSLFLLIFFRKRLL